MYFPNFLFSCFFFFFFFFFSSRRRHTRYWRDWSSDVCSSDLLSAAAQRAGLSLGELAERTVPDGGLDEDGERVVMAGGQTARLKVSADWRILAEWQTPRGWAHTAPTATPTRARQAVKPAARQGRAAL